MKRNTLLFVTLLAFVSLLILPWSTAHIEAAAPKNWQDSLRYPIEELGNCADRAACKVYCDVKEHHAACKAFADRATKAMNDIYIAWIKYYTKLLSLLRTGGPGGCKVGKGCEDYCKQPAHQKECIDWSADHGFMTKEDAKMTKWELDRPQDDNGLIDIGLRKALEPCVIKKIGADHYAQVKYDQSKASSADQQAVEDCLMRGR